MRDLGIGLGVALLAALLAGASLARPGYYDSHDGLLNVHRLFELERCFDDGQIPCRWVPDMGAGYGYPLFVFYPPLGSYLSLAFRALGAGYLDAVKWTLWLALLVAAASMFGLAQRFFGPAGGSVAAVLYCFAPYPAADLFVRGALAECWGLALLPLVFWTGERVVQSERRSLWIPACALAWTALLLAHLLTALMVALPYGLWLGTWMLRARRTGRSHPLRDAAIAHGLALALSAWFLVPALLELPQVHAETLTSLYPWARFQNNFLSASELLAIRPAWGFGPFRSEGGMALFLGPLQLLALGAAAGAVTVRLRREGCGAPELATAILGGSAVAAGLMTLSLARPVWERLGPLAFLQFPWRFLAIATLGACFAAGYLPFAMRARPRAATAAAAALGVAAVVLGWDWLRPAAMHPVPDGLLARPREIARARHGLFDFLPKGVDLERFLAEPPPVLPPPVVPVPSVTIRDASRSSDTVAFTAEVRGPEPRVVTLNVFSFPGWTLEVDGVPARFAAPDPRLGRLQLRLDPGVHEVRARFRETPLRRGADAVSAAAAGLGAVAWIVAIVRRRRRSD